MTQTTETLPHHPTNALMSLIVTLLLPTFLGVTAGDIAMARMAAIETINDYRARNNADLIAIAQIIACGLAALGSLSLSMDDEISLSMTLRLRSSAVALNRSAEQNRRVLNQPLRDNPTPYYLEMPPDPETKPAATAEDPGITRAEAFLSAAAAQELAAESEARLQDPRQIAAQTVAQNATVSDKRHQEMRAIAMVKEASEITASIPHLPPAERPAATVRAAALGSAANELLTGVSPPRPGDPPMSPRLQAPASAR
jgi:hypothetical protein